jgi:hypothetical protein
MDLFAVTTIFANDVDHSFAFPSPRAGSLPSEAPWWLFMVLMHLYCTMLANDMQGEVKR